MNSTFGSIYIYNRNRKRRGFLQGQSGQFKDWENVKQTLFRTGLNFVRVLHKSVPLTEKRPRKPDTGIMERDFRLEHSDYPFRRSVGATELTTDYKRNCSGYGSFIQRNEQNSAPFSK